MMAKPYPTLTAEDLARMAGPPQICDNCQFFYPTPILAEVLGECRRHAPALTQFRLPRTEFPLIEKDDWCGDFQRKTTRPHEQARNTDSNPTSNQSDPTPPRKDGGPA